MRTNIPPREMSGRFDPIRDMGTDHDVDNTLDEVYVTPIRTAQFGGHGGGFSSWAPGANIPKGNSKSNSSVNQFVVDESFDTRLRRVHRPPDPDPERNVEKRLEHMHAYAEEDAIPYNLTFEERQRLKIRQMIRRREQFLEDAAKSINENSVPYVKEHFQPRAEHMVPIETSLDPGRQNEERTEADERSKYVDESWPQIKPTRRHTMSQVKSTPTSTVFDNVTEEESPNPFGGEKNRLSRPPFSSFDQPIRNFDLSRLDQMNSDWGHDLDGTGSSGPREQTLTFDYPMFDSVDIVSDDPPPSAPDSAIDDDEALSSFLTMEEKLNKTKRQPSPLRLQDTPDKGFSIHDHLGNDPKGSFDAYPASDPSGRMFPRTR